MVKRSEERRGRKSLNEKQLWLRYKKNNQIRHRNAIILLYIPLIKHTINKYNLSRAYGLIEYDDIKGWATIGLIRAVENYDPTISSRFISYACKRIRGEVLDGLRRFDEIKRYLKQDIKTMKQHKKKRRRTVAVAAARLSRRFPERMALLLNEEPYIQSEIRNRETIYKRMNQKERHTSLRQAIEQIKEKRIRDIVKLHGLHGYTLKETGNHFNLSEARICQLFNRAKQEIKATMTSTTPHPP